MRVLPRAGDATRGIGSSCISGATGSPSSTAPRRSHRRERRARGGASSSSHSGRICTIGPLRLLLNSRPSSSRSQKRRLPTTPARADVDLVGVDEPQRLHRRDRDADDLRPASVRRKPRPGGPPVVAADDERARVVTSTPSGWRTPSRRSGGELDLDLARLAGVVRRDRREVRERRSRPPSISSPCALRRLLPRAEPAEPDLHLDGRQPGAEQRAPLVAHRAVAGDEQHRAAPVAAQRGVDPGLADERPVEAEVLPRLAGDGVREDAVARCRPSRACRRTAPRRSPARGAPCTPSTRSGRRTRSPGRAVPGRAS